MSLKSSCNPTPFFLVFFPSKYTLFSLTLILSPSRVHLAPSKLPFPLLWPVTSLVLYAREVSIYFAMFIDVIYICDYFPLYLLLTEKCWSPQYWVYFLNFILVWFCFICFKVLLPSCIHVSGSDKFLRIDILIILTISWLKFTLVICPVIKSLLRVMLICILQQCFY
jgi:hypothetical protein